MKDNSCLFTVPTTIGAVWELTYRCNFGCLHCCNNSMDDELFKKNELTETEVKNGIEQLVDFGVESMYLSGGDPLLRDDFLSILAYARKKLNNRNLFFATNGKKVTKDIAQEIAAIDIGSTLISLDGHTPKLADKFRNTKDAYNIALRAIRLLKEANVPVTIGSVIWKETYNHIEDLVKIGVREGVDTMFFSWMVPLGRAESNPAIAINFNEYESVGNQLREMQEKYANQINIRFRRFEEITNESKTCPGGINNYHLIPDGRVSVCSWAYKLDSEIISTDSIKNKPFKEIVHDEKIRQFKEMVLRRNERGLGPGCPVLCHIEHNSYYSKDPLYKSQK
jgi:MoaA/NifB/PqqE/SkfB family radical SAM enzyme